jgi:catechol 2,3-dioxygenase-like lactoylglutathione lyase family enzyme
VSTSLTDTATFAVPAGSPPAVAPRTTGMHHVALRVTDLGRARLFYLERLGFPLVKEAAGAFLFAAGGVVVGVRGPAPETDPADAFDPLRVGLDHLALTCPDEQELRRVAAALSAAGIEHTGVKRDAVFGNLYLAFRDPDGIKWEFYLPG